MYGRFSMNGQDIRSRVHESRYVLVGIRNHQVDVQRQFGSSAYRFHDGWADSDIWNEMAIHHVHVQKICPGFFNLTDVLTERGKVRRKDRRCNTDVHWLTSRRMVSVLDKR